MITLGNFEITVTETMTGWQLTEHLQMFCLFHGQSTKHRESKWRKTEQGLKSSSKDWTATWLADKMFIAGLSNLECCNVSAVYTTTSGLQRDGECMVHHIYHNIEQRHIILLTSVRVFHHSHAIIFPSWHPGVISWCCGIRPFIIHMAGRPRLIIVFYVAVLIPFLRKWAWFISCKAIGSYQLWSV